LVDNLLYEEMFATSEVKNLPRVVNLVRDGMSYWQIGKLSGLVCDWLLLWSIYGIGCLYIVCVY